MEWRLLDEKGEFLQAVNCQYDACDIARWEYGATELHINFTSKEASIRRRGTDESTLEK